MMLINPFMVAHAIPHAAIPASTKILMPFTTASGFTDIANNHAITVIGSPTISTTQSKFGAGSLRVSSGNCLRINSTSTLDVSGKKPFTFECWVYLTSDHSSVSGILSMRSGGEYCPFVVKETITFIGNGSLNNWSFLSGSGVVGRNTWSHIALVFDGTTVRLYVNGTFASSGLHPSWPVGDRFLNVGYDVNGVTDGYINDLRISDYAVYTSDFTPSTSPF